jgi:hypothetical protein
LEEKEVLLRGHRNQDVENQDSNSSPTSSSVKRFFSFNNVQEKERGGEKNGEGTCEEQAKLTRVIFAALDEKRSNLASMEEELRAAHLKHDELKARHEKFLANMTTTEDNSQLLSHAEFSIVLGDGFSSRAISTELRIENLIISTAKNISHLESTLECCLSLAISNRSLPSPRKASIFTDDISPCSRCSQGSSPPRCSMPFGSPRDQLAVRDPPLDSPRRQSDGGAPTPRTADGLFEELRLISPSRMREHAEGLLISNNLLRQAPRTPPSSVCPPSPFPPRHRQSALLRLFHRALISTRLASPSTPRLTAWKARPFAPAGAGVRRGDARGAARSGRVLATPAGAACACAAALRWKADAAKAPV